MLLKNFLPAYGDSDQFFLLSSACRENFVCESTSKKPILNEVIFFFLLVLAANLHHLCYDSDFVQILNKSLLYLWFKRFISFFFFSTQNFLLLVLKQHITNSSLKFCCRLVYCDKFNNFQKFFIYKDLSPCTSINLFNLARELNNLSLVLILITPS